MKKLIATIISTVIIAAFGTVFAFADNQTTDTATSATTSTAATTTTATTTTATTTTATSGQATNTVTNATYGQTTTSGASFTISDSQNNPVPSQVSITPDSPLYFLKTLIENVKVSLTFSADNKAELLVSLAGERLAEAKLMTERNKEQLVEKVMKAYVRTVNDANEQIKAAATDGKDVKGTLDDIRIVELSADKLVIKATGVVPKDSAAELQTSVANAVKETLAVQAFAQAKADFFKAKNEVKQASEELKTANASGDAAKIKAAQDKLNQAQQNKDQMEKTKNDFEAYKNQIVKEVNDQEKIKDEDKDDDKAATDDKAVKKSEKLKEQLEKQAEHKAKMEEKAKDKFEKAKARIERKEIKGNGKAFAKHDNGKDSENGDDEGEGEDD